MNNLILNPVGKIKMTDGEMSIHLEKEYINALQGLDGFGHVQVFWWFDGCDDPDSRANLTEKSPYKNSPETLGVFATRAPQRPNPIALTTSYVTHIDYKNGIIYLAYIDADDNSPVIDIKPYTPSLDRIENPLVPDWCSDWPNCNEESGKFDWSKVFNF